LASHDALRRFIEKRSRHLNRFVLPALFLFPEFQFLLRFHHRVGQPGIRPDRRDGLAGEVYGFGELLALDHLFHFTDTLLEQVLFFSQPLLIPARSIQQLQDFGVARKLLSTGSEKMSVSQLMSLLSA